MNNVQKAEQLHKGISDKFKAQGCDDAKIKDKLIEVDTFIYEMIIHEHINALDEATYLEFKKLVEANAKDEEINKIIKLDDESLQEKVLQKLENYLNEL